MSSSTLLVSLFHSLAAADISAFLFVYLACTAAKKQQQQTHTNAQNVFGRFFCVPCCGRSPNSMPPLCIFLHLPSISLLDSVQVIENWEALSVQILET
jgi:hypothetical protein